MSEIFAKAGLNESGQSSNPSENEAGENASVCSSITYAPGTPFSANTDHGASCASNIPSPIMEEEAGLWMNIDHVDHMPEDLELDVKPCLDGNCLPHSTSDCCRQDSSSDDMFMCRLEELLQAGTPQELVGDSRHTCVDDLFPSLGTGQDSSLLDAVGMWSVESLQSLEPLPFQEEVVVQPEPSYGGEEENVSQMFAEWLRSNAHCISLSDLRKIKLKTSTIENATRRLGGGKKGLMLFVKFVLMWVQNCHMKQAVAEAVASSAAAEATQLTEASLGFLGASAVTSGALEGHDLVRSRDSFGASESSCVVQSARSLPHTLYNGSTFSQLTIPSCTGNGWNTSKARWTQTPNIEHNVAVPAANSFTAASTGGGSPLPFCRSEKLWLQQSSMLCGVSPSMQTSLRSPAVGANCLGDAADMMMMMQQQQRRFDVTPAATTRAARKSRMERQRWSVRRNRKWSVAAHHHHHHHHHLSSAASVLGANANLPSWTAAHNLPYNSRTYQRLARSGMDCQQGKKSERNLRLLFHKELKQSDVGNLGRIVLPKKAAETSLPPLELRDGLNLIVEDLNSSKVWNMRYRFWPNNKSRMYLLENTGDFVKSYDLKEGDYMMLYCNNSTNKYMIRGAKGERPSGGGFHAASNEPDQAIINPINGGIMNGSPGGGEIALASNSEESCDDSLLAELIEQSLEDIKDSSETEMSDLLK